MSNSLLMNLMIEKLLNENPRLKKNLLREAGEYPVLTPREQGMGINIDDTDEIAPLPNEHKVLSPSELNKVKEPKKGGLVSALKKIGKYSAGTITIGMLAIANFHDLNNNNTDPSDHNTDRAIHQIAKNNDVLANQIENELSNDDKLRSQRDEFGPKVIYKAKRPEDFDKLVSDFIISNEGFTSKPHSDVKQVSIGHGTSVSDGTTQIPKNWKKILYKKYDVPKKYQKLDPINKISRETARHIFDIKYKENKRILDDIEYIHVFPEHIQKAIFDLAFNMGTNFLEKFANFNEQLELAANELRGGTITPSDIDNANTFLDAAKTELIGNYDETGRYEGETKYRSDLKNRSDKIVKLLSFGVSLDDFEVNVSEIPSASYSLSSPEPDFSSYSQLENKKYSLKSVFFS